LERIRKRITPCEKGKILEEKFFQKPLAFFEFVYPYQTFGRRFFEGIPAEKAVETSFVHRIFCRRDEDGRKTGMGTVLEQWTGRGLSAVSPAGAAHAGGADRAAAAPSGGGDAVKKEG
jgi:hypothetical protein